MNDRRIGLWGVTALSLCLLLNNACAPRRPRPAPAVDEDVYFFHTIAYSGENLTSIAKWYTGSTLNWTSILNANPGLDVKRLRKGETVRIPRSLVVREAPMPSSAISSSGAGKGSSGAPAGDPSLQDTAKSSDESRRTNKASSKSPLSEFDRPEASGADSGKSSSVAPEVNESSTSKIDAKPAEAKPEVVETPVEKKTPEVVATPEVVKDVVKPVEEVKPATPVATPEAVKPVATATAQEAPKEATKDASKDGANKGKNREELLKELLDNY